jgi:hypothetical protein
MTNDQLINEAIAILQTMNMEDCALAIHNLREEHNRVRIIAHGRLVKIGNLQHDVAVLEDKLEDTRSELKSTFGGSPSRALEELEIERNLAMIYEHDQLGREPRTHLELGL